MPSLTLLPTSHMPTPQLSTTPSTPDSSTPLLSPTSTMPLVRCAWKQGHAVTLVHQNKQKLLSWRCCCCEKDFCYGCWQWWSFVWQFWRLKDESDESLSQVMLLMMRLLPLRPMCMTPPVQNDWQTWERWWRWKMRESSILSDSSIFAVAAGLDTCIMYNRKGLIYCGWKC